MLLRDLCEYLAPEQYLLNSEYSETVEYPALPNPFLSPMCDIEDKKPTQSRLSEKSDYVHVSSLLDLCPRQYTLARHYNLDIKNNVFPGERIIWEMGKALEAHVIRNIREYHGFDFVFNNIDIMNNDYMIRGAPDACIVVGDDISVILEVKTMKADDFKKLERPKGDHVLQAAMYQWLYNNYYSDTKAHDTVIILYVSKDAIKASPYKEFQVDVNEAMVKNGVNIALKLAKELKDAQDNNIIPRRHICNREDCARARNCPVAKLCFEGPEEEYGIC